MYKKTVIVLLSLTLVILVGSAESFARPQYLSNLPLYGTSFENTRPGAALMAIGPPHAETAAPADTPETGIQATPEFEIMVSLVGLFAGSGKEAL